MAGMDAGLLIVVVGIVGIVAALAVVAVLVLRADRGRSELEGRLAAMAEAQTQTQGQISYRLIEQERALTEALAAVGRQVGERLEKSGKETGQTLAGLRERLAVIDAAQKNITELSSQVVSLQDILANKQARGAFGEVQLKDLVESILPASAYEFQATIGEGRRVDCLLKLPNPPGPIGVDAKFPLEAYHALRDARDEPAKVQASRAFGQSILKHVRDIKEKYILPGETAEAALMFLPSEAVYAELHANFASVVEQSFRAHVFIVSPTTMWATLNTVRAVFRDVRMRDQAHIIQKELHVMLADVARLDKRVGSLEQHFNLARRDIDDIRTSATKVTRRAGRIQELDLDESEDGGATITELAPARQRANEG